MGVTRSNPYRILAYKRTLTGDRSRFLPVLLTRCLDEAVQQVGPAVVRVETETYVDSNGLESTGRNKEQPNSNKHNGDFSNGDDEDQEGDVFDGVPEAPLPPLDHHRPPGDHSVDFGQGSGIILNAQGFVLTNAHVVEGVDAVHVTLTDGRRFRAETRGADDIIDVAVLQIVPDEGVSSGGGAGGARTTPACRWRDWGTAMGWK